jgi:hypothetical protein
MVWMLWVMYLVGGGVGLMIIGKLSTMVGDRVQIDALVYVVVLAVGNAGGRVVAQCPPQALARRETHTGRALRDFAGARS